MLGFEYPNYFACFFKRELGYSLSHYKKSFPVNSIFISGNSIHSSFIRHISLHHNSVNYFGVHNHHPKMMKIKEFKRWRIYLLLMLIRNIQVPKAD